MQGRAWQAHDVGATPGFDGDLLAGLAGQLEFNRTGEQWVLDIGLLMRASILQSDGPAGADRQEWALRSFLRAMELLQNARAGVGDAADAAERVLSAALE